MLKSRTTCTGYGLYACDRHSGLNYRKTREISGLVPSGRVCVVWTSEIIWACVGVQRNRAVSSERKSNRRSTVQCYSRPCTKCPHHLATIHRCIMGVASEPRGPGQTRQDNERSRTQALQCLWVLKVRISNVDNRINNIHFIQLKTLIDLRFRLGSLSNQT